MCLYLKSGSLPKKATEDITCYKVIIEESFGGKCLMTPYQGLDIDEKIISGKKPFKAEIWDFTHHKVRSIKVKEFQKLGYNNSGAIGSGAIHTFKTKEAAKTNAVLFAHKIKSYKMSVYKCIIPKGTLYYESVFNPEDCFASQKIIFKESIFSVIKE